MSITTGVKLGAGYILTEEGLNVHNLILTRVAVCTKMIALFNQGNLTYPQP